MNPGLTIPDREDLQDLFDLEDSEDLEMLRDLYEHFLDEGTGQSHALTQAMDQGNLQEVDEIAHKLKSSFGNVGLGTSSEICGRIMGEARSGRSDAASEGVARLASLVPELQAGIREFMRSL